MVIREVRATKKWHLGVGIMSHRGDEKEKSFIKSKKALTRGFLADKDRARASTEQKQSKFHMF